MMKIGDKERVEVYDRLLASDDIPIPIGLATGDTPASPDMGLLTDEDIEGMGKIRRIRGVVMGGDDTPPHLHEGLGEGDRRPTSVVIGGKKYRPSLEVV